MSDRDAVELGPAVGTRSSGFGRDLVELYEGLAADNSRAYWQSHKQVYDTQVRAPLETLASDLAPVFGEAKIFRPHRDVRFSPDERPYQEHASTAISPGSGTALYLQVSADELLWPLGCTPPPPTSSSGSGAPSMPGLPLWGSTASSLQPQRPACTCRRVTP